MTTIRALSRDDLSAVTDIVDATELFPSEMLADMAAGYLDGTSEDQWWVAVNPNVVGFAYCAPEKMTDGTWNLLALAVYPDHQRQGIGDALIGHTRTAVIAQKARLFLIETADLPEFAGQRALYQRAGLTQMAHIPEFYDAGVGKVTFGQMI